MHRIGQIRRFKPTELRFPSAAAFAALVACVLVFSSAPPSVALPAFERELDTIPLYDGLGPVPGAWHGGWETPRPQLVDIDDDGDLDLFVAEDFGRLRFYRNDGDSTAADFVFQTDDFAGVHELYFMRFHDVDSDGDQDLLVEAPPFLAPLGRVARVEREGAYLYTNVGTPSVPVFANLSTHPDGYFTDNAGDPIPFVTTAPDFVDIEPDGDADLFMGDATGSVILYRNVGSPGSPSFQFETDSYQDLLIIFGGCGGGGVQAPPLQLRHGFMLFSFFDFNNDLAPDLFVGDQFNSNVYHYRNLGGSPSPDFTCVTDQFFPDGSGFPGFFPQYLMAAFGHLDNDGNADAILGSGVSSLDGLYLFSGQGTSVQQVSSDYLREFDLGREGSPALADLDGDLDLDLVIGIGSSQEISFYENIGSPAAPEFALIQQNWIPLPNSAWAAVEFADIDGDLDQDLFAGMTDGAVRFWRNDGIASWPPAFVEILTDPDFGPDHTKLFRSTISAQAVPRFLDEDNDGDLDVLVGQWSFTGNASLYFFENVGSDTAHSYVLASADYQGLGTLGQNLAPFLADLDGDTDPDLLVGSFAGTLQFLRNDGAIGAPVFVPVLDEFAAIDVGSSSIPYLADVDADSDLDLLVGERGGGLNFYRNQGDPAVAADILPPVRFSLHANSPNPFDGTTRIRFAVPTRTHVNLSVHDIQGRLVRTLASGVHPAGEHVRTWDGRDGNGTPATAGVYFSRLETAEGAEVRKMVLLR